jgi:hypothetical protein
MKYSVICAMVLACALIAGCTSTQVPPLIPSPTAAPVTKAVATASPQPSFSMGDHYLQKSYSFQSENDTIYEEFHVDIPSWAIGFDVLPLNDNLRFCWFVLNVTNMNTGHTDTFGYGRDNSFELHQKYPMYTTGPYKIEMKGNRVKVDLIAAKRNP